MLCEVTAALYFNQIPRPEGRGMLFSRGGCTQGFNTFLTALKLARESVQRVLNLFGTNKKSPQQALNLTHKNLRSTKNDKCPKIITKIKPWQYNLWPYHVYLAFSG